MRCSNVCERPRQSPPDQCHALSPAAAPLRPRRAIRLPRALTNAVRGLCDHLRKARHVNITDTSGFPSCARDSTAYRISSRINARVSSASASPCFSSIASKQMTRTGELAYAAVSRPNATKKSAPSECLRQFRHAAILEITIDGFVVSALAIKQNPGGWCRSCKHDISASATAMDLPQLPSPTS